MGKVCVRGLSQVQGRHSSHYHVRMYAHNHAINQRQNYNLAPNQLDEYSDGTDSNDVETDTNEEIENNLSFS